MEKFKSKNIFNMEENTSKTDLALKKELANFQLKTNRDIAIPQLRRKVGGQMIQKELDIEQSLFQGKLQRNIKNSQNEQEENLAQEVNHFLKEKIAKEKHRLQLRQNSIELRELEQKIRTAYYCKERDAQLQYLEAQKIDHKRLLERENEEIKKQQKENIKEELQSQQQLLEEKLRYNDILAKQLEEQEFLKQSQYEEHLQDKLIVDEIIRKIYEEDQRILEEKQSKMIQLQQEAFELQKTRQLLKQKELENNQEENRRIMEYNAAKHHWESQRQAEIRQRLKEMEILQDKLKEKLHQQNIEKLRLEIAREEISLAEWEEVQRQKAEEELKYRFQQRLELKNRQKQEMQLRSLIKQRQEEEEEEFKRMMMVKLEEEEQIERANALRRYRQQLQYKEAIEKLIDDRKAQHILQIEEELKEIRELEKLEKKRIEEIEEEKLCLIKEHANNLSGYLDKGLIPQETLEKLDDEFKNLYLGRERS